MDSGEGPYIRAEEMIIINFIDYALAIGRSTCGRKI